MIKELFIKNYKSVEELRLGLGRFNVFIGENGSGKSNLLECLVFASLGIVGTIENDSLALRGVRPSEPKYFRSGFEPTAILGEIELTLIDDKDYKVEVKLNNANKPFSKWTTNVLFNDDGDMKEAMTEMIKCFLEKLNPEEFQKYITLKSKKTGILNPEKFDDFSKDLIKYIKEERKEYMDNVVSKNRSIVSDFFHISDYIIYAPENYFLRNQTFDETYVEPLGYRGEGLLNLLKIIKREKPEQYKEILSNLNLISWFGSLDINDENGNLENEFQLSDRYIEDGLKSFDIRNSNEGFLFVLFYLTLFISDYTPKFFAIDNIDTALNPKLCSKIIKVLFSLSKKYNKQVILTTHNPSVLDGINLNDNDQRLYVISRNKIGRTKAVRIEQKKASDENNAPTKLSEQFLRGFIGGLPKNF